MIESYNIGIEPKIIIIGYSPKLYGGVTNVTNILIQSFTNIELHTSLYYYSPKIKAVAYYIYGIMKYIGKMYKYKKGYVVHLIIGSKGDAIRIIPYIWLSRLIGLKICAQYHTSANNIFPKISSAYMLEIIKISLRKVQIHCFHSKRLKENFDKIFPNKFQSIIIPNPLGKEWIEVQVLPRNKRHRDIVFFGRWSSDKGIEDLLKCMEIIKSEATCEIYTNHVPKKLFKKCKIFPWVDESNVMKIMSTAKLVVLPSYSEAYPTVLLEAVACGTPFLASNIPGILDIAEQSCAGRVFDVGNINMLAENIDNMLSEEKTWNEMSMNGKVWVCNLSREIIREKWLEVYKSLEITDKS